MKLYSYNSQYPTEIPFRIKLSNGMTRTDPSSFTPEEIADAGYVEVSEAPVVTNTQIVVWNSDLIDWEVRDKTQDEINSELDTQWNVIRLERDRRIQDIAWRYQRIERHARLGIDQIDDINTLDQYVQALADIPQTQTDPFNIVWPTL